MKIFYSPIYYSDTSPNSQKISGKLDILCKNSFDGLKYQKEKVTQIIFKSEF